MLYRGLQLNRLLNLRDALLNPFSGKTVLLSTLVTLTAASTGCSIIHNINDGSLDYRKAQTIAPLQVPADIKTRQITPLYPVPVVAQNEPSTKLVLTNAKGNRFNLPKPEPLDPSLVNQGQTGGTPGTPTLVIDGNGYPILKVDGDASKIWDDVNRSLSASNVNVATRNPAANEFDVVIDKTTYQLRLGRIGNTTTITLQNADATLVDKTIATDLLDRISQNWSS